jgi:PAS domain S-box-containing protein
MANKTVERSRIDEIADVIMKMAGGDYSVRIKLSGRDDALDRLATGVNTMLTHFGAGIEDLYSQSQELRVLSEKLQQEIARREQAEEALKESEEKFAKAFWASPEALFITRISDKKIIEANESFTRFTGYTFEEASKLSSAERNLWVYEEEHDRAIRAFEETGRVYQEEIHSRMKSGEIRVGIFSAERIDIHGEPCLAFVITDITERKKTEEELAVKTVLLEAAAETTLDGIIAVDENDRIILYNKRFQEMFNIPPELIADGDDIPLRKYVVSHLEDTEAHLQKLDYTYADKERVFEIETYHRDGRVFANHVSPLWDEQGNYRGKVTYIRDITERKKTEEELARKNTLLEAAAETTLDGIVAVDENDRIILYNRRFQEMFNVPPELIADGDDMQVRKYIVSQLEDNEALLQDMESTFADKERVVEKETYHKDGRVFTNYASPLRDRQGNYRGKVTYIHDITSRKRVEEDLKTINTKLEESNRDLQDFVYIASHDLREPLRKIASFGALLQDSLEGRLDEDQQENFGFMIDGAKRMQAMVDDLLTYSRVTTKARPFAPVDLNQVIEDLKRLELATILEETKGTVIVPETLPPVQGDSSQLHQLLQNLMANGIKFRDDGVKPEITIRVRGIQRDMIHVEIQDNGIGIDEKYHEQIFTMFKRLHSRAQYEGTGIGLAVCQKIVRRHGGEIGVESTPGKGSTFWFTLPKV